MTLSNKDKIEMLKSTIEHLYCKEGRSKSYIANLLDVDRKKLTQAINDEWKLEKANIRHMLPSNKKFLNKHRELIKSRFDHDYTIKDVAVELGVSRYYLSDTIVNQDDVLLKAWGDCKTRSSKRALERVDGLTSKSSYDYDFEEFQGEKWKEVLGYEGYMVSTHGRVKSYAKRYDQYYLLTSVPNKSNNRLYVGIQGKNLQVSRLVGFAFVEGYSEERNTIEHIDNDVQNNHFENLRWVSQKENNRLAFDKGRAPAIAHAKSKHFKKIVLNGFYEFKTIRSFAKFIGKSETQAHRYIYGNTANNPYDIKLIY